MRPPSADAQPLQEPTWKTRPFSIASPRSSTRSTACATTPSRRRPTPRACKSVAEQLDQCWDLLRQRRAKREFGADPESAKPRDIGTVENYTN